MKENIKYFETLNDANGYLVKDIPFTGYIKENGLVIFNNKPNKMLINLNGYVIIHEIVNVIFETLNDADGYIIETIPFSCYIKENYLLLECNLENCKIVIEDSIAIIKERGNIIRYTATSKVTPHRPASLPTIVSNVFDENARKGVIKFASDVNGIGEYAFYGCRNLTSLNIPDSVMRIGEYAFGYCNGLTSVTIPNSVTSIGESAFENCSGLTSVTIGNSVASIGGDAFEDCTGLTSVTIPNSVANIGQYAFSRCYSLASVTIPNSVTTIGDYAFNGCRSLTSITIPNSVTNLGNGTFYGSSLISMTIPNSVTNLGNGTFIRCASLTSITIPNSIMSFGDVAFDGCTKLTSISYTGTISQYNSITKGSNWRRNVPATVVHCTDGDTPI